MCVVNVGVKDCFEEAAAGKAHPEDGREEAAGLGVQQWDKMEACHTSHTEERLDVLPSAGSTTADRAITGGGEPHESNSDKTEAGYIQLWWRAFRCKSAIASAATSLATVKGVWLSPASGRCQLLLLLQFQKTEKRKLSMWEAQGYTNPIFITFILNGVYLETWIKSLYYPGPFFLLPRNGSPKKRDGY